MNQLINFSGFLDVSAQDTPRHYTKSTQGTISVENDLKTLKIQSQMNQLINFSGFLDVYGQKKVRYS